MTCTSNNKAEIYGTKYNFITKKKITEPKKAPRSGRGGIGCKSVSCGPQSAIDQAPTVPSNFSSPPGSANDQSSNDLELGYAPISPPPAWCIFLRYLISSHQSSTERENNTIGLHFERKEDDTRLQEWVRSQGSGTQHRSHERQAAQHEDRRRWGGGRPRRQAHGVGPRGPVEASTNPPPPPGSGDLTTSNP